MKYQFQPTCQILPSVLDFIYCDAFGFKTDGCFVEIGAHDGWHWSNTWGLAQSGWRGLCAEPLDRLYKECQKTHSERPNVTVVNCAIGDTEGMATLGIGDYGAAASSPEKRFSVQQFTLDTFLELQGIPTGFDLLVIDVEGSEPQVLSGYTNAKWQPKVVIIERPPVPNQFSRDGYDRVYADWINTVYVRRDPLKAPTHETAT